MNLAVILLAVVSTLFGAFGAVLLKRSSPAFAPTLRGILVNRNLVAGAACYGIALVLFTGTYRMERLSLVYPLIALSYIWVAIFSRLFLKEKMTIVQWAGILLIVAGIGLVHLI